MAPEETPGQNRNGGIGIKRKTVTIVAAVILFLLALVMTLYPVISNYVNQKYASEIHTSYQEVIPGYRILRQRHRV